MTVYGEPLNILLVEDNEDHAEMIKRSFEHYRIANRMYHVNDGEAALNFLYRQAPYEDLLVNSPPNLVLLDLRLPKMDGLQVLKEIKEADELCMLPVVILTSSEADNDICRAYRYHANSYLVKPLDFAKFSAMMNELGMYWLGWNTDPFKHLRRLTGGKGSE